MGQREILLLVTQLLSKHRVPYLLTGSFAVSYYGFPRATHDIDFIIEVVENDEEKIIRVIKDLGGDFIYDNKDVKDAISKLSQFNIYHPETGIKIDFWLNKRDDFETKKFKRGKKIRLFGKKISIITAEDLLLTKLLWCKKVRSERHMGDCTGIWKIQKENLDRGYLMSWAEKLGVEDLLAKIRRESETVEKM